MTKKYTAVLSVHGIGRHRRHANAGALLSALESVAGTNDNRDLHTLIKVTPGIEPSRDASLNADVPMLHLTKAQRHYGKLFVSGAHRIYEVNWSPDTRARLPVRSMIRWSIALVATTLRQEPSSWLSWPRLRVARLRLAAETLSSDAQHHALAVLASAYRNYRGSLGTRHRNRVGGKPNFSDFLLFAKSHAKTATTDQALKAAAAAWCNTEIPAEKTARRAGWSTLWGFALTLLALTAVTVPFFSEAESSNIATYAFQFTLLIAIFAGLIRATRFLTTIFSDVRYWSALSENDNFHETRNSVLDRTAGMIRHLVSDPSCVRVVIVSHSLGTAIAYDALRAIGLHNSARQNTPAEQIQIRKVDCLITMGSPIDKLALLFETTGSHTFREELMRDELRGDLTTGPFWARDRQRIRWINFWDPADPISDPLYSPLGAKPRGGHFELTSIDNVEVANTSFFAAAASHKSYLSNTKVTSRIFQEVFQSSNFVELAGKDYGLTRTRSRNVTTIAIISLASLLLGFTLSHWKFEQWLSIAMLRVGAGCFAASVIGLIALKLVDHE